MKNNKLEKVISFFEKNEIIYETKSVKNGQLKIWNPYSESWMFYYVSSGTISDSTNCKIGNIEYDKLLRFSMKGRDVRYDFWK